MNLVNLASTQYALGTTTSGAFLVPNSALVTMTIVFTILPADLNNVAKFLTFQVLRNDGAGFVVHAGFTWQGGQPFKGGPPISPRLSFSIPEMIGKNAEVRLICSGGPITTAIDVSAV